jgi:hypothetical protein
VRFADGSKIQDMTLFRPYAGRRLLCSLPIILENSAEFSVTSAVMNNDFVPYKPFDAQSHADNDSITRIAVSGMLVVRGWSVNQSGVYDIDFSCRRPDGSVCHVEVDRRLSERWGEGKPFPFPTYELGARKRELLEDPNAVFVTANQSLTSWIAAPASAFDEHGKLIEKPTRYGPAAFISLPVTDPAVRQGML